MRKLLIFFLTFASVVTLSYEVEARRWAEGTAIIPSGDSLGYLFTMANDNNKDRNVIIIPDGKQDLEAAYETIKHWEQDLENENWNVFVLTAVKGKQYHRGAEVIVPMFLKIITEGHELGGFDGEAQFSLLGLGTGGKGAFRIFSMIPNSFHSFTSIPGTPSSSDLNRLRFIPETARMTMYASAADLPTRESTSKLSARLERKGVTSEAKVIRGTKLKQSVYKAVRFINLKEDLFYDLVQ